MRVAPAVLAIFAACGARPPVPLEPAWTSVVAVPLAREAAIDVLPADLGDEAAIERMRHRVRVMRIGRAWLRLDATPINDGSGANDGDPSDEILPVIGETASRIRVVTEEDGACVAMWIDRRDAWESVIAPVQLEVGGGVGTGAASGGSHTAGPGLVRAGPASPIIRRCAGS